MSIILSALKKIGTAGPSERLENFRKKAKAENLDSHRASVTVQKPSSVRFEKPQDFRLKVVGPQPESIGEKISGAKAKVGRWPAWAQGIGLGVSIVFFTLFLVLFGKFLITLSRAAPAPEIRSKAQHNMVISAQVKTKSLVKNAAGFWAQPWMWASARPRQTAEKIQNEVGEVIGLAAGEPDSSWIQKQFRVSGIIVDKAGEEMVIINDRTLRVGDKIAGAKVVKISPEHIELTRLNEIITLDIR